jgi:cellulose synthase/poly-beta-1,6-N-acetylglucosamine synthase-like glycosyltransferase
MFVTFLEVFYLLSAALLAVYGYNALMLAWHRARRHKAIPAKQLDERFDWPEVTIQLPVYNEKYVVARLIAAVCNLDYPWGCLQVQVLDDSTDITQEIIAQAVKAQRARGVDIEHIRRPDRHGYKGGALAHGLKSARGDYIAIFDADFIPPANFLKEMLPYFTLDPKIGCLQARWGHLNQDISWLTRAQANGIDGHFIIEQEVRSESKFFLNFNGTAGVWKKACIESAGGWQHDTLTEDLDLSYRAQLAGWEIRYIPHVQAPAELPVHINALKRQQFRWAKGSIQTARKLLGSLWRSSQDLSVKIEGSLHLTHYIVHPLMLFNLMLTLPLAASESPLLWVMPAFILAALGPLLMYWIAMGEEGKKIPERMRELVVLLVLGMGLSLNNSRAVLEAVRGRQSPFLRTPKYNLHGQNGSNLRGYILPRDSNAWVEGFLAVYALGVLIYVLTQGIWGTVLWLALHASGYSYISSLNFQQPHRAE